MTDELVTKAVDLQKVLRRCSKIVIQNSSHSTTLSHDQSNQEIDVLNNRVADLQTKVTSLKKYIKQLELERVSQFKNNGAAGIAHDERQRETPHSSSSSTIAITTSNGVLDHCSIDSTSEELCLLLVFKHLSILQLLVVQQVCKKWRRVSQHPSLWQHLVMVDLPISHHALCKLGEYCSQTTTIHLQGLVPSPALPDEDLESYISRQKASLEPGLNVVLSQCGSTLTQLIISECSLLITERCLWIVSKYCTNLKEFVYNSNEFPATVESLWSLANSCTGLRELHLYPPNDSVNQQQFNDRCLHIISNGFPVLSSITIGGSGLTITGIGKLGRSLKHLRKVSIIQGPSFSVVNVTNHITSECFSGINSLYLIHTRISPQALVKFIETHPNIKTLEVTVKFTDYFPNDTSTSSVQQYERIINNLQALTVHFRYGKIFKLICK